MLTLRNPCLVNTKMVKVMIVNGKDDDDESKIKKERR